MISLRTFPRKHALRIFPRAWKRKSCHLRQVVSVFVCLFVCLYVCMCVSVRRGFREVVGLIQNSDKCSHTNPWSTERFTMLGLGIYSPKPLKNILGILCCAIWLLSGEIL